MGQYDAQEASIRRQQMIAKALRDSGNQGFDPAATAGKLVYARSPWEDLSRIAQQGLAGRLDYLAEKKATDLQDQRKADAKTRLAGMVDTLAGKSAPVLDQPDDPALSPISGLSTIRNPVTGKDEPLSLGTETNAKRASLAAILKGADPEAAAAALEGPAIAKLVPKPQDPYTLNEGDVRFDGDNKLVAAGLPKTEKQAPEDRMLINIVDPGAAGGYRTIRRDQWQGERLYERPRQGDGPTEPGVEMDDETLDLAARDVMQDPGNMRQYASFGASGQNDRTKINNRISKILKDAGMTQAEMTQLRARAKGEIASTVQLTKQLNAVESYEKLAKFNGQRILELIDGVDETGIPAIEGAIRKAKKAGGNVDQAEFNSILNSFQTEVARIITQPNLTGVLSDTARKELQEIVAGNLSAPQMRRVINRINLEMDTRASAVRQQLQYAGQNMVVAPPSPGSTQPLAPQPTAAPTDAQAEVPTAVDAAGNVVEFRNGAWVPRGK